MSQIFAMPAMLKGGLTTQDFYLHEICWCDCISRFAVLVLELSVHLVQEHLVRIWYRSIL